MELSKRLLSVASLVSINAKVADIGCDHGYVSIYLCKQRKAQRVIAMDVNAGPLERAREHIQKEGLQDYIDTRLSDGAKALLPQETDTLVIAGMGGRLMIRILEEGIHRLGKWKELVLQPQSEIYKVRQFLVQKGYCILEEDMVLEDGKYYQIIKALAAEEERELSLAEAYYGPVLLAKRHPVCMAYLKREEENYKDIKEHIIKQNAGEKTKKRLCEIEQQLQILAAARKVGGVFMAKVTINGKISETETGKVVKEIEEGTAYAKIAEEYQELYNHQIALVCVDGKIKELFKRVQRDCELSFVTLKADVGHKSYVRSATMLLMKAIHDVVSEGTIEKVKVEFAIGKGYYCSVKGNITVDFALVQSIAERMHALVEADLPIFKSTMPIDEAVKLFEAHGMTDKVKLFRYRRSSVVNIYEIDGYYDYYYGYMLPSTGYIKRFTLQQYEDGFILNLPERQDPTRIEIFEPRQKLFQTMKQATAWGDMLGMDTVGDLNDQICKGGFGDLILVQEALQERRIGEIAKDIAERKNVKFVMIAGPSSSGKTTFSHRLSIQLRTYGLKPHPIALDDYFKDRELTPRDENGDYNFECLEALDVDQFNEDMGRLLKGEAVKLPSFNFKTGHREYKNEPKKLGPDDILVLEGIHGLNDKMSYSLPLDSKYKIYISALTSLNVDEHNRIPTTDGRLIRRMVRDARTRGASAKRTIQMWASVRRGEEENIFPFQEEADAFFNSTLIYELAVLKQFAEPLLFEIKPEEEEYYEAKRLLKFLEYFLGVSSENLPNNSIVREFVGGSCFPV